MQQPKLAHLNVTALTTLKISRLRSFWSKIDFPTRYHEWLLNYLIDKSFFLSSLSQPLSLFLFSFRLLFLAFILFPIFNSVCVNEYSSSRTRGTIWLLSLGSLPCSSFNIFVKGQFENQWARLGITQKKNK